MIVTLCGSTRHKHEFGKVNSALTLEGHIVLAPGCYGHADNLSLTPEEKRELDALHLVKISMSSRIYVISPEIDKGEFGESTTKEIEYAIKHRIPISIVQGVNLDGSIRYADPSGF